MSALFEFLDWWWPDLGWEEHRQAIIASKRFLQPLSPQHYHQVVINPQLRAAWTTFTYCFFNGTGHLQPGGATEAKAWLTRMVGEQGFTQDGPIVTAIRSWIASMRPRIQVGCSSLPTPCEGRRGRGTASACPLPISAVASPASMQSLDTLHRTAERAAPPTRMHSVQT
jgi:hypothetical protein